MVSYSCVGRGPGSHQEWGRIYACAINCLQQHTWFRVAGFALIFVRALLPFFSLPSLPSSAAFSFPLFLLLPWPFFRCCFLSSFLPSFIFSSPLRNHTLVLITPKAFSAALSDAPCVLYVALGSLTAPQTAWNVEAADAELQAAAQVAHAAGAWRRGFQGQLGLKTHFCLASRLLGWIFRLSFLGNKGVFH